ncbi:MAG: hypothetical protein JNL69_04645 [Bacteroidia bacterium]|nr:hypothetical protein [Bacteroidia bacterium]
MIETSITIGGFVIYEPTTVFTDLLISILCLIFIKKIKNKSSATNNWKLFFAFFSLATFIGACSHAFFKEHTGATYNFFWLSMQVLNMISVFFAQQGTYYSVLVTKPHSHLWRISYYLQLILFVSSVFIFHNFIVVVIDNAIGLIPIMIVYYLHKDDNVGYKFISGGILISFFTAFIHGAKLSLHAYFNQNDISHCLLMISLYYMYIGVKKFPNTISK